MMRLDICSVILSTHIDLTDSERESSNRRPTISFDVFPNDRDYIELETGEVFCNPQWKFKHKDKDFIDCQVSLYVSSEQRDPQMFYWAGGGSIDDDTHHDSRLSIVIPLLPSELDFILKNIQSGIFPETMSTEWETNFFTINGKEPNNIIKFGWEPDGSHQIWNNAKKEDQKIKLSWVGFSYSPLPAKRNAENNSVEIPEAHTYPEMIRSELSLLRKSIETG